MKRTLTFTWTCSESITIDIPDGTMTRDEVSKLIEQKADDLLPGGKYGPDDWGDEWEGAEPKYKGESDTPPDDFWFEIAGITIAITGHELITKDCKIQFSPSSSWKRPIEIKDKAFLDMERIKQMPLHTGLFDERYRPFLGHRVVGNAHSWGYVLGYSGQLIAALIPMSGSRGGLFQFNTGEKP